MRFTLGKKKCRYCLDNVRTISHKDLQYIQKHLNQFGKIDGPGRSGNCKMHQKMVAEAIKRARFLGLLPYTYRQVVSQ